MICQTANISHHHFIQHAATLMHQSYERKTTLKGQK